jgi:hypothetical protein
MNGEIDPTTQTGLVSYYNNDQGIAAGTNTGLTTLIDQKGNNNGMLTNMALTSTTSNFVVQNSAISVLPLSWLGFTAVQQQSKVLLSWATAEEENTANFVVEQSTNGTAWNNIGTVQAAGNSTTQRDYTFIDPNPAPGINFYQIKEQDLDGELNYSEVASVTFTGPASQLIVFPNPLTTGNLNIKLPKASTVFIYNITGDLLMSKEMPAGTQQLNTGRLSKGIYFLKAGDAVVKIVIL